MPRSEAIISTMEEDVSSTRAWTVLAPEDTVVPVRWICSMTPATTSDTPRTRPSVSRQLWAMRLSASASRPSSSREPTSTRPVRSASASLRAMVIIASSGTRMNARAMKKATTRKSARPMPNASSTTWRSEVTTSSRDEKFSHQHLAGPLSEHHRADNRPVAVVEDGAIQWRAGAALQLLPKVLLQPRLRAGGVDGLHPAIRAEDGDEREVVVTAVQRLQQRRERGDGLVRQISRGLDHPVIAVLRQARLQEVLHPGGDDEEQRPQDEGQHHGEGAEQDAAQSGFLEARSQGEAL